METKMKFKVGDKVRVKSLEWYNQGFLIIEDFSFTEEMSLLCGKIVTIDEIREKCYLVKESDYYWCDWMLEDEPVTEEKQEVEQLNKKDMETKEMTQEEKELLIKDLSARLHHKVKASYYGTDEEMECTDIIEGVIIDNNVEIIIGQYGLSVEKVKPYLFPLSSMTEEQRKEFDQIIELELKAINDEIDCEQVTAFEIDFYNKHHLDWRGLIPKGLALDATGLNIY